MADHTRNTFDICEKKQWRMCGDAYRWCRAYPAGITASCSDQKCLYCSADADTVRRRAGGMTPEQREQVLAGRIVELPGAVCVLSDGRVMSVEETWRYNGTRHTLRGARGRPGPNGCGEPMAEFITDAGPLSFDAILSIPACQWMLSSATAQETP